MNRLVAWCSMCWPLSIGTVNGNLLVVLLPLLSLVAIPAIGQTPSLVQYASDVQFVFNETNGQYILSYLPNPAGAGNLITVCFSADPSGQPNVSDDGANSYHLGGVINNGADLWCYYAYNVKAGTRQIKVTAHGVTYSSTPVFAEWAHVLANADPLDGHHESVSGTSTIAAGNVTPTQSGDLVVQFSLNTAACCYSAGTTWAADAASPQPNITWALWAAENEFPVAGQWGVYNSTAALSATMRETAWPSSNVGASTVAMFFKADPSAGTSQPPGIRVLSRKTINFNSQAPYTANPRTMQVPCPSNSNLLVMNYASGGTDLTSVTSSGLSWVALPAVNGGTPFIHNYYATGSLSPTTTVTFQLQNAPNSESAEIYCVTGAATSPFDLQTANATGDQTVAGNLNLITITPTTSNGLIFVTGSQEANTSTRLVGANQLWDGCFYSAESASVSGCSQNNPFGHYYNPNTSSINFSATQLVANLPVAGYVAEADAYKAAGETAPAPPTGLTVTVH